MPKELYEQVYDSNPLNLSYNKKIKIEECTVNKIQAEGNLPSLDIDQTLSEAIKFDKITSSKVDDSTTDPNLKTILPRHQEKDYGNFCFGKALELLVKAHYSELADLKIENARLQTELAHYVAQNDLFQSLYEEYEELRKKYFAVLKKHDKFRKKLFSFLQTPETLSTGHTKKFYKDNLKLMDAGCVTSSTVDNKLLESELVDKLVESQEIPISLTFTDHTPNLQVDFEKKSPEKAVTLHFEDLLPKSRAQMKGYECDQCEKACGLRGDCRHDFQQRLNKVSRHRFLYSPAKTPPKFWDLTFPSE